jgi:hypothetical protein
MGNSIEDYRAAIGLFHIGNRRPFKFNFPVYSYGDLFHNYILKCHSGRLLQFISEKKNQINNNTKKKMEFSQETQVLVKIENCLIVSLSYN